MAAMAAFSGAVVILETLRSEKFAITFRASLTLPATETKRCAPEARLPAVASMHPLTCHAGVGISL